MSTNSISYEQKRAEFRRLCERAKGVRKQGAEEQGGLVMAQATEQQTLLLIEDPEMLGNSYEEIIENLNRLADANLALVIVPRSGRS